MISKLKEVLRQLVYRPAGISMGAKSAVMRPWKFVNSRSVQIGKNTHVLGYSYWECVGSHALSNYQGKIIIGDNVLIGYNSFFTAMNEISIGDGCVLSGHVYITDENHGFDPLAGPILEQPLENKGPVRIGKSCFLGYRVAILPGVNLGEHCVVGTGSTVTHSFPAYSMLAGSPARLIKTYSFELGRWVSCTKS